MPIKSLDINLIKENEADLTFFNIDEEESNETLKTLKQTYVTANYKEETILNLQSALNSNSKNTSKELKLESYKRYNNALELARKNYITTALEQVESALEINPKDIDILNLKGLLKLLKCDFSKGFESFYTGMCYGNNNLSKKYVDMLSSEDFNVFLTRYNHSIRFINEELNQESMYILDNIIEENPELIEPYVILALLYDKLNNTKKKDIYLERLKHVDMDNPLLDIEGNDKLSSEEKIPSKTDILSKKGIVLPYVIIGCLVIAIGFYYANNRNRIEDLNKELAQKSDELDQKGKELSEIEDELNQASNELDDRDKELEEANEQLDKTNEKLEEARILNSSDSTIYNHAMELKRITEYDESIKFLKHIVNNGSDENYISSATYQIAIISEIAEYNNQAISYYRRYINNHTPSDGYYEDAYYRLGMLYYNNGDLSNAKSTFNGLITEMPNSIYNNSTVRGIINE